MKKIFCHHPHSIGESYLKHWWVASRFGFSMMMGGLACIVHSIFPFWFEKTGSDVLMKLMHAFIKRMPNADQRVQNLGQLINQKMDQSIS